MVEYFSLKDWHHFFLDQGECKEGYLDGIEYNVLLNNVLFLTDNELSGVLEVFKYAIEQNLIELIEIYGKDEAVKKYSEQHYEPDLAGICSKIRGMSEEDLLNEILKKVTKAEQSQTIIVTVPPAFVRFGGFSVAGDVKKYFPEYKPRKKDEEQDKFGIISPDGTQYKAHRSQISRIKIIDGAECFRRLDVKENDKLEIEIIEPLKRYRILRLIHTS